MLQELEECYPLENDEVDVDNESDTIEDPLRLSLDSLNDPRSSMDTKTTMQRMSFTRLCTDIKAMIISHVFRPSDMVSLCLTSKELHELTVRQLYHTITLDVGCDADKRLPAFLHPRNIGLEHIRNVDLYRADVSDACNQMRQADFAIRMLLEYLPQNQLEKFSWHPWCTFSTDSLILLYKNQRKMRWLEAITLDRPLTEKEKKRLDFDKLTETVTRLGLYPESRETLEYCNMLLSRVKRIDKLTLHANFDDVEPLIPTTELNDSPTNPGLVSSTIFGHLQPFAKCTPYALKELTLQKIHLRYAESTYCKFIDFTQLKSLRVFSCSGAEALFAELSRSTGLPEKLETLEFKHEDDNRDCEGSTAVDGFLCLVIGIKRLSLDIAFTKNLPSAACITRHAKTLNILNVHACSGDSADSDEDELVFSQESFEKICNACTSLEQVSLAFPNTCIVREMSDQFTAFGNALARLQSLVTLNITTWPSNNPSSVRLPRKIYDHLLQGMAQWAFDTSATKAKESNSFSRLNCVAFGTCEKIYEREDGRNTTVFVKGRRTDFTRPDTPVAMQIGWCLRKYVEPRSAVLDFALMRAVRPPTREPPPSDDSEYTIEDP